VHDIAFFVLKVLLNSNQPTNLWSQYKVQINQSPQRTSLLTP